MEQEFLLEQEKERKKEEEVEFCYFICRKAVFCIPFHPLLMFIVLCHRLHSKVKGSLQNPF